MTRGTWVPVAEGSPFPLSNLPYGVFSPEGGPPRVGVAIGSSVRRSGGPGRHRASCPGLDGAFAQPSLNSFLGHGPRAWAAVRERLSVLLRQPQRQAAVAPALHPVAAVRLGRPFEVADFVDFYSSLDHATNMGQMLRPGGPPLPPAWRHLPIAYHGRAGTVGGVRAPRGAPMRPAWASRPFGPSARLDFEAEVGFVVGVGSRRGHPVAAGGVRRARLRRGAGQRLERPRHPGLGVPTPRAVPRQVLRHVDVAVGGAPRGPAGRPGGAPGPGPAAPGLPPRRTTPGRSPSTSRSASTATVISRPPFAGTYWTPGQQLAHLTANGASLRTGDLFASGTVSGPGPGQRGSLMELAWNGTAPLTLADGQVRAWLADGDTVAISAWAPGAGRHPDRVGRGQRHHPSGARPGRAGRDAAAAPETSQTLDRGLRLLEVLADGDTPVGERPGGTGSGSAGPPSTGCWPPWRPTAWWPATDDGQARLGLGVLALARAVTPGLQRRGPAGAAPAGRGDRAPPPT